MKFRDIYLERCRHAHRNLLGGTCPWCGGEIIKGRESKESIKQHQEPMITRRAIDPVIELDDVTFAQNVREYRAGNGKAAGDVYSAFFLLYVKLLRRYLEDYPRDDKLRLIALIPKHLGVGQCFVEAMTHDAGTSAQEFLGSAERELTRRWRRLVEEFRAA